jgi:response regulator of citrate/malate metabolism
VRGIKNHQLEEFKEFVLQNSELTNQKIGDNFGISDSTTENYLKKVKITRKKDF